jgi:hypothetical protein
MAVAATHNQAVFPPISPDSRAVFIGTKSTLLRTLKAGFLIIGYKKMV